MMHKKSERKKKSDELQKYKMDQKKENEFMCEVQSFHIAIDSFWLKGSVDSSKMAV